MECLWNKYKNYNYNHKTCTKCIIILNIIKIVLYYTNNVKAYDTFPTKTQTQSLFPNKCKVNSGMRTSSFTLKPGMYTDYEQNSKQFNSGVLKPHFLFCIRTIYTQSKIWKSNGRNKNPRILSFICMYDPKPQFIVHHTGKASTATGPHRHPENNCVFWCGINFNFHFSTT